MDPKRRGRYRVCLLAPCGRGRLRDGRPRTCSIRRSTRPERTPYSFRGALLIPACLPLADREFVPARRWCKALILSARATRRPPTAPSALFPVHGAPTVALCASTGVNRLPRAWRPARAWPSTTGWWMIAPQRHVDRSRACRKESMYVRRTAAGGDGAWCVPSAAIGMPSSAKDARRSGGRTTQRRVKNHSHCPCSLHSADIRLQSLFTPCAQVHASWYRDETARAIGVTASKQSPVVPPYCKALSTSYNDSITDKGSAGELGHSRAYRANSRSGSFHWEAETRRYIDEHARNQRELALSPSD